MFKAALNFSCDPTAMVIAITPSCVKESKRVYCAVEVGGGITRGQMVVDWNGKCGHLPNVELITKVDVNEIKKRYVNMLK